MGRIKIGVIPAAGRGERLGYLSNILPKTLFPLYDRPILHYVINQMEDIGVTDIYIIINTFKEQIIKYCKSVSHIIKPKLHFIEQNNLNGTAEAILLVKKEVGNNPFIVIYGDDCTVSKSLPSMVNFFFSKRAYSV